MNWIAERKKQRRDYLKKKGMAYFDGMASPDVFVPMQYILFAWPLFMWLGPDILRVLAHPFQASRNDWLIIAVLLPFAVALLWAVIFCLTSIPQQIRDAVKSVAYVPPVRLSTPPAEAVLVRGAEVPAATRETLLRAAGTSQDTHAGELLRSSQE